MAQKDKTKWNEKYKETPALLKDRYPSKKLQEIIKITKGKKALEIACGTGRNTIFLASKGYEIDALDISDVALEFLNSKNLKNVHTKQIDLENYTPQKNTYDLIVKTNYLDREIIPLLANALKKDGILFIETYMNDPQNDKKPSRPEFLLDEGELKTFFNDSYEIVDYDESFNAEYEIYKMKKQSIIVKRL